MIAINNKLPSKQLPSPDNLEALIVQIFYNNKTITLWLMYIPPSANADYQDLILKFLPVL